MKKKPLPKSLLSPKNPLKTAKLLVKDGFPIQKYIDLQERRKERLKRWNDAKIEVLIKTEQELINYGDQVIAHMNKLLSK